MSSFFKTQGVIAGIFIALFTAWKMIVALFFLTVLAPAFVMFFKGLAYSNRTTPDCPINQVIGDMVFYRCNEFPLLTIIGIVWFFAGTLFFYSAAAAAAWLVGKAALEKTGYIEG